jgi:hypothetical protein
MFAKQDEQEECGSGAAVQFEKLTKKDEAL